jgi:hypothetical protein
VILLLSLAAFEARAQERLRPLVERILAAWRTADLVCLGEDHARKNDSDLRLALVRHPWFAKTVSVVVVEFANPAHQVLLDRFIVHGDQMSRDQIAVVWRDATGHEVWESPIYETFLRAIRDLNRPLPAEKRVRVLAGDTSVDWKRITTADQLVPLLKAGLQNRGGNIRRIIAEQVLEKKIKALAIYGSEHCVKVAMGFPGELMDKYPGRMWSVASMFSGAGGHNGRALFHLSDQPAYIVITGTKEASLSADGLVATRPKRTLGDMVDAFVYYGDLPDTIVESDLKALEATYGAELARRRTLMAEAQRLLKQQ